MLLLQIMCVRIEAQAQPVHLVFVRPTDERANRVDQYRGPVKFGCQIHRGFIDPAAVFILFIYCLLDRRSFVSEYGDVVAIGCGFRVRIRKHYVDHREVL